MLTSLNKKLCLLICFIGFKGAYLLKGMEERESTSLSQTKDCLDNAVLNAYNALSTAYEQATKEESGEAINWTKTLKAYSVMRSAIDRLKEDINAWINGHQNLRFTPLSVNGHTLLHVAVFADDAEVINKVVAYGMNVNCYNEDGEVALHLAAKIGSLDAIRGLINAKATIDPRTHENLPESYQGPAPTLDHYQTPLHLAVEHGETDAVTLLMRAGANSNLRTGMGRTALELARLYNKQTVIDILTSKQCASQPNYPRSVSTRHVKSTKGRLSRLEANKLLLNAASTGDVDGIERALQAGANLEVRDNYGNSALLLACGGSRLGAVAYLIKKGSNVHVLNNVGYWPLYEAAGPPCTHPHYPAGTTEEDSLKIVELLIEAGSAINYQGSAKDTPLHRALHRYLFMHSDDKKGTSMAIIKALVQAGARIAAKDSNGQHSYEVAYNNSLDDVTAYFRTVGVARGELKVIHCLVT